MKQLFIIAAAIFIATANCLNAQVNSNKAERQIKETGNLNKPFPANEQTVTIRGTRLKITFPSDKWKGNTPDFTNMEGSNSGEYGNIASLTKFAPVKATISRQEKEIFGESGSPFISIIVEKKPVTKTATAFAAEKNSYSGFTILKTYTEKDANAPIPGLTGAVVQMVTQEFPFYGTTKGYQATIVHENKGIVIHCLSWEQEFEKYNNDFMSILRSITAPAGSGNQIPPAIAGKVINVCDYFPLGKKMKYTYREVSSSGNILAELQNFFNPDNDNKTLIVEYTYSHNKTVNGKQFKGYKIKSKDQTKNGRTFYYNCSNNDLKAHCEIYEWYDEHVADEYRGFNYVGPVYNKTFEASGKFMTLTELKGSVKTGEKWEETVYTNGKPMKMATSIEATGLTLEVNDETYKDVIKVVSTVIQSDGLTGQNRISQEIYYAKGVGKIKEVNIMKNTFADITMTSTYELIDYTFQ